MKLAGKNEAGQILVLVLILLALGPLLVVPMLRLSYSGQMSHQIVEINTLNAYAADSGVEYARHQIFNYPAEIISTPLDRNLVINNIAVHVTVNYDPALAAYRVISTASSAQRSATIEVMIVIDVGLFGNVVAVDGNLAINQTRLENPAFPGESDVYVNGSVTLQGSQEAPTLVDGDVTASGTVTVGEHSTVTGIIREGATVMAFPPVNAQIHEDKAKAGGTYNGNYTLAPGTHYLGPLYINGNLSIPGHPTQATNLTLQGTVYVTGTVSIDRTTLYGFGDIFAEGNISITRSAFNLTIVDVLPMLMSVNENISIQGTSGTLTRTQAIIYAPTPGRQIDLQWAEVVGSVAAPTVLLFRSTIDYPAALRGRADLPGAGLDTITYTFK